MLAVYFGKTPELLRWVPIQKFILHRVIQNDAKRAQNQTQAISRQISAGCEFRNVRFYFVDSARNKFFSCAGFTQELSVRRKTTKVQVVQIAGGHNFGD